MLRRSDAPTRLADVARRLGLELVDLNRDARVAVRAEDAFVMEAFAVTRTAWEACPRPRRARTGVKCHVYLLRCNRLQGRGAKVLAQALQILHDLGVKRNAGCRASPERLEL